MEKQETNSRIEIGMRFRQFRRAIHKAQHELASDLDVSQSTIANIESGKSFPNISYLRQLYFKYCLDSNWLLNGQGEIFMKPNVPPTKHLELLEILQIPFIAQIIMAKLVETKVLLKDVINNFFDQKDQNDQYDQNETD